MAQWTKLDGTEKQHKKTVWYSETDTLKVGYLLCYDRDHGTSSAVDLGRAWQVEKPSDANVKYFAGVVCKIPTVAGVAGMVEIVEPTPGTLCSIWCEETCVIGTTILSVKSGSYAAGGSGEGPAIAIAQQTVTLNTTNGLVQAEFLGSVDRRSPILWSPRFTPAIWHDCPMLEDPTTGALLIENFTEMHPTTANIWTITQAASAGTFALSTAYPGVALAAAGDDDDGDGVNVQRTAGPIIKPQASTNCYFEAAVAVDYYTQIDFFLGLANADTSIIATSANSATTHVGFVCVTENGVVLGTNMAASSGETHTGMTTLANGTLVRFGIKIIGVTDIEYYVNGTEIAATVTAAKIPALAMYPSIVCQSNSLADAGTGTVGPTLSVDYMAVGQTYIMS